MPTANSSQQPDVTDIREALQALLILIADAVSLRLAANDIQTTEPVDTQVPSVP